MRGVSTLDHVFPSLIAQMLSHDEEIVPIVTFLKESYQMMNRKLTLTVDDYTELIGTLYRNNLAGQLLLVVPVSKCETLMQEAHSG